MKEKKETNEQTTELAKPETKPVPTLRHLVHATVCDRHGTAL